VKVAGIDISGAMVEKLRAKPGGTEIPVTIGDFANVDVEGDFSLIFIVFNTLFALTSQEDQIRCIANAAAKLAPGGRFVTECFFPDLSRFRRHQNTEVLDIKAHKAMFDLARHDPVKQTIDAMHVVLTEEKTKLYPVSLRYAYPSELDLMARLAGLTLEERWGGWHKQPFTSESPAHISVFRKE
jgi:SAM-dependent methyltransferase